VVLYVMLGELFSDRVQALARFWEAGLGGCGAGAGRDPGWHWQSIFRPTRRANKQQAASGSRSRSDLMPNHPSQASQNLAQCLHAIAEEFTQHHVQDHPQHLAQHIPKHNRGQEYPAMPLVRLSQGPSGVTSQRLKKMPVPPQRLVNSSALFRFLPPPSLLLNRSARRPPQRPTPYPI